MGEDIVLITMDCWRPESLQEMPALREFTSEEGFTQTDSFCPGASTWFAFPSIHSSLYAPQAYSELGNLTNRVKTLAEVLSEAGYATGGFIGANPYTHLWTRGFDEVWNGGLESASSGLSRLWNEKNLYQLKYLALRERTSMSSVVERAKEWYNRQDSPRFLWVHLMDTHEPYLPGLKAGLDVGLIDSYKALWELSATRGADMSPEGVETHRQLYEKVLHQIDEPLVDFIDSFDDSTTICLTADHGQEIERGMVDHKRMYESVVRTPFLCRWTLENELNEPDVGIRQLDIAPTIVEGIGEQLPDSWEGSPIDGEWRDSFSIGDYRHLDSVYTAVRTEEEKFIKTFDYDTREVTNREYYRLEEDPDEAQNLYPDGERSQELESKLARFLGREDIRLDIYTYPPENEGGDATVEVAESRLRELGYIE